MTSPAAIRLTLHRSALAGMQTRPKNLLRALAYQAEEEIPEAAAHTSEEDFQDVLYSSHSTDQLVELWRRQLTQWDYAEGPGWTETEPRTDERRAAVFSLLGLNAESQKLLVALIPVPKAAGQVVITTDHTPWYTPQSQQGRTWYWPAYRRLLTDKGWPETAIAGLDAASDSVVGHLADPTSVEAYQSKGLVVGYVQSGKTANFTGVIAKAIDAGYRLVIVLGGTLNLLRAQTQRRLDMELVGRENILRGAAEYESDYADDPAWSKGQFLTHGGLPSALGGFDIVRMTTRDNDYKSLLQGIVALEFEKQEPALPLHDPRNLHRSSARLMVVKKNKAVLTKLVKDLNKIKTPLSEIPVLIIDDESDEASVNTASPNKPDAERTAINQKISELLCMLPRAQYVGYTATPFANVFVDPSDTEDIFPKDFIVSLPRPAGYMGVQDFHDLESPLPPAERTFANSNERAHVRDIKLASDTDETALQQAMDMFVLTAAMKLYREANGLGDRYFQHHTMLIHESRRTADHRELHGRVSHMWWNSGYAGPSGHERLRKLFDTDLAPVSRVRGDGHAVPASYDELAPYIGAAAIRIGGDDKPIIVVNGDKDIETGEADFDKRSIWKILIGGQKLARGFTVEGLTITYYRRRTNNASTLMQMGRWFGFRKGYRDLVRLYLGREEAMGKKDIDLYEAFEAICLDEETFREQLRQYAEPVDGASQVTPAQVPPLVSQHLSWLPPVSANKMYNAELLEIRSPGKPIEPAAYPTKAAAIKRNTERWRPLLDLLSTAPAEFASKPSGTATIRTFKALTGTVRHGELVSLLAQLEWERPGHFVPHLTYLRQLDGTLAKVDDWLVLAPQLSSGSAKASILGSAPLSLVRRSRQPGKVSFGRIAGLEHRNVAQALIDDAASDGMQSAITSHGQLMTPARGVVLLYPVVEGNDQADVRAVAADGVADPSQVIMACTLIAPKGANDQARRLVRFRTKDSSHHADPIVPQAG
ncbi:Z1 domain-containing protein [Streptomyces alfalfae]|uniref:Z1 domain-containing protein n=1 Tax=Streptomyces alfalfae TaxID=1642299 RepID=A0A7T4PG21_9ACTN|nr:Z1 domain-containing protein [Streptomyces alfalfae]QQC89474.1 Z1 domain-containing protein [Streptomyces alfalfae]